VGASGIEGSEAARAEQLLASRFQSPFSSYVLLVVVNVPPPTEAGGRRALREIVSALEVVGGVTRTLSYTDVQDPRLIGESSALVVVGLEAGAPRSDQRMAELRRTSAALRMTLRKTYPDADLLWTGWEAFDYDFRRTSAQDLNAAELRALPLTLILLMIAFGSVIAALLPIAMGVGAIGLSLGVAVLLASQVPLTILLQNIVSMLGLGIGIDYSLLMVSRFREALAARGDAKRAASEAVEHAGHTIVVSGCAVAVGFAALGLIPVSELRSLAVGGFVVTVFSMLLAVTLLPAVLSWLGPRIDLFRLPRPRRMPSSSDAWRVWARWVAIHPLLVLMVAGAPLLALGWQVGRMSTAIPSGDLLPGATESQRGVDALRGMGRSSILQTVRVVVELPPEKDISTKDGWQHVLHLSRELQSDARVAHVQSLPLAVGSESMTAEEISTIPPDLLHSLVSRDRRLALIELVPREEESLASVMRFVRELRASKLTDSRPDLPRHHIGGLPASNVDYENAVAGSFRMVIVLVLGGTFAALVTGFRSVLIAAKAIMLNALTVAAAMGVIVLVFQDGYGITWLGLANPIDGLFPAVPVIVFCIVFGLSMDYEIFLMARIREYVDSGMPDDAAMVEGLARTAGVITSAALLMVVVFAAFALTSFLVIKILGMCLAVAIAIDATVVRMAVGPALFKLAGRWNWWPAKRQSSRSM